MGLDEVTCYFTQYGAAAIFVIVLLEYMNPPGFPAGIIMPLSGVWAARGNIHLIQVMGITLAAGLAGSWILYFIGYAGGNFIPHSVFLCGILSWSGQDMCWEIQFLHTF